MHCPSAILTDIEGTTTPIRFVHDVLFPYARARLPAMLANPTPEVTLEIDGIRAAYPAREPLALLHEWMDQDIKATPLKALQGMAWRAGYEDGSLRAELYPDVAPSLRAWHAQGIRLSVYSSGSVEAQRLLFGHSQAGDLTALFASFHDTTLGPKRAEASYRAIAGGQADSWLFLSDSPAELQAAAAAGMSCIQLVRAEDGTVPAKAFATAVDFGAVAALWRG